jgi:hypothetical protein
MYDVCSGSHEQHDMTGASNNWLASFFTHHRQSSSDLQNVHWL